MTSHQKKLTAGLNIPGVFSSDCIICFIEYFPKEKRFFLSSLKSSKDLKIKDTDSFIIENLNTANLESIITSAPVAQNLIDKYEQEEFCLNDKVLEINKIIEEKKKIASSVLKRKLNKGFHAYMARPLDIWIHFEYHELIMKYFKSSWDVFIKHYSTIPARIKYLWEDIPNEKMKESHYIIGLIELKNAKILDSRHLYELAHSDTAQTARANILKQLEKHLALFIYKNDFDILVRKPKAFEAMILALSGQYDLLKKTKEMDNWAEDSQFMIPSFK